QRRALGEGKLHDILVGFASADDAVVRPNRSAHPLPLIDDVRVGFLDELAHSAESFPAPAPEFGDSFRDELRCRLALARARLFHVLILEVPEKRRSLFMVVTVRGVWHAGLERSNVTRLLRSGAAFVFRLLQCRYRQVSTWEQSTRVASFSTDFSCGGLIPETITLTLRTVGPWVASSGLRWQGLRGATVLK